MPSGTAQRSRQGGRASPTVLIATLGRGSVDDLGAVNGGSCWSATSTVRGRATACIDPKQCSPRCRADSNNIGDARRRADGVPDRQDVQYSFGRTARRSCGPRSRFRTLTRCSLVRKSIDEIREPSRRFGTPSRSRALVAIMLTMLLAIPLAGTLVSRLQRLRQAALQLAIGGNVANIPGRPRPRRGRRPGALVLDHAAAAAPAGGGSPRLCRDRVARAAHAAGLARGHARAAGRRPPGRAPGSGGRGSAARSRTRAVAPARRLAADLLDLSRIDAEVSLRSEPIELGELGRAVMAEFELPSAGRGVTVSARRRRRARPGRWPTPAASRGSCASCSTTRCAWRREAARSRCRAFSSPEPTLIVSDQGPGVAQEERALIFERFKRGRETGGEAGFGLGLAIGRELAQRMGGSLVLTDTERSGRDLHAAACSRPRRPPRIAWPARPASDGRAADGRPSLGFVEYGRAQSLMLATPRSSASRAGSATLLPAIIGLESMGVPSPGETALVAAAVLASQGHLNIWLVILIGASLGDRRRQHRLPARPQARPRGARQLGARSTSSARRVIEVGDRYFKRHGAKTVFIGRWIAWIRFATAWLAGINHMPFRVFFPWNAAGGITWAITYGLLGYFGGQAVDQRRRARRDRRRDRAGAGDRRRLRGGQGAGAAAGAVRSGAALRTQGPQDRRSQPVIRRERSACWWSSGTTSR